MSIIKTGWSGPQELDDAEMQAWLMPNEALLADYAKNQVMLEDVIQNTLSVKDED